MRHSLMPQRILEINSSRHQHFPDHSRLSAGLCLHLPMLKSWTRQNLPTGLDRGHSERRTFRCGSGKEIFQPFTLSYSWLTHCLQHSNCLLSSNLLLGRLQVWWLLLALPLQISSPSTVLSSQTSSCLQRQAADAWTPVIALSDKGNTGMKIEKHRGSLDTLPLQL